MRFQSSHGIEDTYDELRRAKDELDIARDRLQAQAPAVRQAAADVDEATVRRDFGQAFEDRYHHTLNEMDDAFEARLKQDKQAMQVRTTTPAQHTTTHP